MKRRILDSTYATAHRRLSAASLPEVLRRRAFSTMHRALTLPPLGTLWDRTLLDRLQMPLSRFRE